MPERRERNTIRTDRIRADRARQLSCFSRRRENLPLLVHLGELNERSYDRSAGSAFGAVRKSVARVPAGAGDVEVGPWYIFVDKLF
jgi:hypothetical protein